MIVKSKKIWCSQEDEALRKIYQQEDQKSWSNIAKRLFLQFQFPRKSAKQCRERYENHISSETAKMEWTEQEQQKMIELHNQFGNKWSMIAQQLPGKSDNCIKNHFYSKLRKMLRRLNSVIHSNLKRQYRQITITTLYKIIEATQQRFKQQPACGLQVSMECQEVQNKMLHVSMLKEEEFDSQERLKIYMELVRDIYRSSKLYKRKSRKIRNASIQAPNTKKKKQRQAEHTKHINHQQGYDSDSSSVFEEQILPINKGQLQPQKNIIVQSQNQNIKDMLNDIGVLKFQSDDQIGFGLKCSRRSSFKSYSQKNYVSSANQFFEDSQNQKGMAKQKRKFAKFGSKLLDDPSGGSEREGFDINFG